MIKSCASAAGDTGGEIIGEQEGDVLEIVGWSWDPGKGDGDVEGQRRGLERGKGRGMEQGPRVRGGEEERRGGRGR